ncbi:MAG: N-acetylneuraminate synthase family protein [Alphaproteobacteria bacterium]|nr:N-acetylneuraminate synthase family protein [Alphaproteobacteria bacterium]
MSSKFSVKLGKRQVSAIDPCYVIAEIGVNHNGRIDIAHRLIDAAVKSGADAVKFQIFKTDELVVKDAPKAAYQKDKTGAGTQKDMLRDLELEPSEFRELRNHCAEVKIDFMSTAFDTQSLEEVAQLDPVCLKWPSGELNNLPFLTQAGKIGLPILLSTGMGSITEISEALDLLQEQHCNDVAILQCVSNYPARIEDQNFRCIKTMSALFGRPVGFSDHTEGPYAALAARAIGMCVLEKHFTLDRDMVGPDHTASTEPAEFAFLIQTLRKIELGLGDGVKKPLESESDVRRATRKSLVYRLDMPKGHVLKANDLTAKRPNQGISPNRLNLFIGRTLSRPVSKDTLVAFSHVQ